MVPQIKLKVHGLIQDAEWRQTILEEPSAGFHKEPSAGFHKEPSAGFIGSVWWVCQRQVLCLSDNVYILTLFGALYLELHYPVGYGEQCVIFATTNVNPGMKTRTPLANNDITGRHFLAPKDLQTQSFGLRVSPIAGFTTCFFMCH